MDLKAASGEELRNELLVWGADAPDRLCRRGRQKELERWVLNRLLCGLDLAGKIAFPVAVSEDENPDFRIQLGSEFLGVEVTEAVDPVEQARWTEESREDKSGEGPRIRHIDLEDEAREQCTRECVLRAYEKKRKRCGESVDALLLYLNAGSVHFEAPQTILSWLRRAISDDTRFRYIWLITDSNVYDLKELEHIATLDRS